MSEPFVFKTSIHAVQLTGLRASNLAELYQGLQNVDGSSVYHHTYRHLRTLHFLPNAYRSDFAQWIAENLKEFSYAERMEALDLREYRTIRDLREALLLILEPGRENAETWTRRVPAGLEFYFCRSTSIVFPIGPKAKNLEEFVSALHRVDAGSLFYHLVEAPLHIPRDYGQRNDFSAWFENVLGLSDTARVIAELNPYQHDLESIRKSLLDQLCRNPLRQALHRVMSRYAPTENGLPVRTWLSRLRKTRIDLE